MVPAFLVVLLLGLCVVIAWAVIHLSKLQPPPVAVNPQVGTPGGYRSSLYRKIGWQGEAYEVLAKFLNAKTVGEKLPYVINSPGLEERMNDLYGGGKIDDAETPVDAFSAFGSTPEDQQRGIFLLTYYRPAQFTLKDFFRPVAPIEVEWGLVEADSLLATLANPSNFTSESLSAMAFFLRTPDGLKLDWDTFVQTRYNTLESFLEVPANDQTGVYRVVIWEDVAEPGKDSQGHRTYQVVPPTNPGGGVRVRVATDSELGRTLSPINWLRVTGLPKQTTRTATVELKWVSDPEPRVVINRFICWEFLGLGGKDSNSPSGPPPSSPRPDGPPPTVPAGAQPQPEPGATAAGKP